MKILVISNGKGEDSIAVTVLQILQGVIQTNRDSCGTKPVIKALPIVGEGNAYRKIGIEVTGANRTQPSGGFPLQKVSMLVSDLRSGLFSAIRKQFRTIRAENPDMILAFGDIFPVILGLLAKKPVIHIGTAYSVHLRKLLRLEKWLFQQCKLVLSRDEFTAEHLRRNRINAHSFGNAMMDDPLLDSSMFNVQCSTQEPQPSNLEPRTSNLEQMKIIGLVPSSRIDAYDNLQRMLEVIRLIPQKERITFLVSVAPNLDMQKIQAIIDPFKEDVQLELSRESLGYDIRRSSLMLGMTGTGNEQVVGLKTPLVLLEGSGPQSSKGRLNHYKKLLGKAIFIPKGSQQKIAQQIGELLQDDQRMREMGEGGAERMGQPGAAEKMAEAILEEMKRLEYEKL